MQQNKYISRGIILSMLLILIIPSVIMAQPRSDPRPELRQEREVAVDRIEDEDRIRTVRSRFTDVGDRMQRYLASLRSRLSNGIGIADQERKDIIEDLSKDISTIQSRTLTIGKTTTTDTFRERAQQLKDYWNQSQRRLKYYVGMLIGSRVRLTIERFEKIDVKINELLTRVDADAVDFEKLQNLQTTFGDLLDSARENYDLAKQEFEKIEASDNAQDLFKAGNDFLKISHQNLREARQTFQELLSEVRRTLRAQNSTTTSTPTDS